jgi:3-oxoacyl-[acyl-carrier protein] reductase
MKDLLVISGGSAGIGLATAERFLKGGYEVVSLSRRRCPDHNVTSIQVDMTSSGFEDVVENWLAANVARQRRIVLIHNASRSWLDSIDSVTAENLRAIFELSVVAPAILNKLLLARMRAGSAIIYVGSPLSERAVPNSFSYVAAKHAVAGMMRATCQDMFGQGIHTVCVCPGITDTDMIRSLYSVDGLETLRNRMSIGRLITPEEIAEALFISAETPVLNGALIQANYGQR